MLRRRRREDVLRGGGVHERNSESPRREAIEKGADVIATSCPFCVMTLEDPATEKGLAVKEISEILMEVL